MQAISLGTCQWHTAEAMVYAVHDVVGIDNGFHFVAFRPCIACMGLVGTLVVKMPEVVGNHIAGHRSGQTAYGIGSYGTLALQQPQEELLHHILGLLAMARTKTAAHKLEQLVAMLAIVLFYYLLITH